MDLLSYLLLGLGIVLLYRLLAANLRGFLTTHSPSSDQNRRQRWDFTTSQSLHASDGSSGLAFDRHRKKLRLLYSLGGSPVARTLDYQDVLSCELREDGKTVLKTERANAIRNPSLGRMPTHRQAVPTASQPDRISRLELTLVMNDPARPRHTVVLLDHPARRGGASHSQVDSEAKHWYRLIKVLIHQADLAEAPEPPAAAMAESGDPA